MLMISEQKKQQILGICDVLIILCVLFIAFAIPFERTFDVPRQNAEYLALFCLILRTIITKRFKSPPLFISLPLFLYVAFSVITIFSSTYPELSFKVFRRDFLHYIVVFFCIYSLFHTHNRIKLIVLLIVIVSIVISLVDIISYYIYISSPGMREKLVDLKFIFPDPDGSFRPLMPFHYHNRLATYLMIVSVYFFVLVSILKSKKSKIVFGILSVFPIYVLVLTLTRAAWIGFAAGFLIMVIYFAIKSRRNFLFMLVLVILIILVASFSGMVRSRISTLFSRDSYKEMSSTIKWRFLGYQGALRMIKEKPLLGFGFGWKVFEKNYPDYMVPEEFQEKRHAHNNYIQIAVESGLITLFFYLWFSGAVFYALIKSFVTTKDVQRKKTILSFFAILIAIYVNALGNFSLRMTVGMLVWMTIALSLSAIQLLKSEEKGNSIE